MNKARAEIARERRRQMQVRKAFEAALDSEDALDPGRTEFYLACVDYIVFSMDRLHAQDQAIHDFLKERIPAEESEAHARLADLNSRQDKSRALIDRLRETTSRFRQAGYEGVQSFVSGARRFIENFRGLLVPRKNPFAAHTDRLFTDADWVVIAGVTDDSLATEERLFMAVRSAAPDGIDPEAMTVEHK